MSQYFAFSYKKSHERIKFVLLLFTASAYCGAEYLEPQNDYGYDFARWYECVVWFTTNDSYPVISMNQSKRLRSY